MNKNRGYAQTRYMRRQLFSLILLPIVYVPAFAAEVNVPLEFNHRFIRELLVSQIYTGDNQTAPVFAWLTLSEVYTRDGCRSLIDCRQRIFMERAKDGLHDSSSP